MTRELPGYTLNKVPLNVGKSTILFSAFRNADNTPVIIKLLKRDRPSPDEILRLKHEFYITQIFHDMEDIVQVYSLEKYENNSAIILENINTPSLREILEQEQKLTLEDFFILAIKIAKALKHIHQANIIHKDINPSNIMCDIQKKKIKIIDFSLSANLPKEHTELVSPKVLEGTPAYFSPEQTGRVNKAMDYRTDYYSLGVTFYQMLTGKLPFVSDDLLELVHCHLAIIPKSPHEVDNSIPEMPSKIVMKLLSKNAEDRYQHMNGLMADLGECQIQMIKNGSIEPFTLGSQDIFSQFQIPEKVYGHQKEISILMNAYGKIMQGKVELLLVGGYSGIGKSSLVNELHKPVFQKSGYFISGKFDQLRHNIPYMALTQAIEELIKLLLPEDEERLEKIRQRILAAVEKNGRVMTDLIPNLSALIGEQPAVADLGPKETQNRFKYVLQNFIQALASKDHPLVIFLDDLQWADLDSLNMIETLLTNANCQYLLIIGAYRNNEVTAVHPLAITLEKFKQENIDYQSIELGPLLLEDVTELIADTLHQNQACVQPLANICYEKTGANPFFLIQLLFSLYKENLIQFNEEKNLWGWDLDQIKSKHITDNIIDLMVEKYRKFSPETQEILRFASCIGNTFNSTVIALILYKDSILNNLQEALLEKYIITTGEAYLAKEYQFAHDRIQQAVYSLISEEQKKSIHIQLARFFYKEHLEKDIFTVVNHYNMGIDAGIPSFIDEVERKKIAELNLYACQLAKKSAAFEPALNYVTHGLFCLRDDSWQKSYELSLSLYQEAIEVTYLNAQFDLVEQYSAISLPQIHNVFERGRLIRNRVFAYMAQRKLNEAFSLIREFLNSLGVYFPEHPKYRDFLWATIKLKGLKKIKGIQDLSQLPDMTDPLKLLILEYFLMGGTIVSFTNTTLFFFFILKEMLLCMQHGNGNGIGIAYAFYGSMLCADQQIGEGYQYGEIALKLSERLDDNNNKIGVTYCVYAFVKPWKDKFQDTLQPLEENFKRGLSFGELRYLYYNPFSYAYMAFSSGIPLEKLLTKLQNYSAYFVHAKHLSGYMTIVLQTLLNFMEKRENPEILSGPNCDEIKLAESFTIMHDLFGKGFLFTFKLILSYYFGHPHALEIGREAEARINESISLFKAHPIIYQLSFYYALTLASALGSNKEKNKELMNAFKNHKKKIKKCMQVTPVNYANKYALIEAEIAKAEGDIKKAEEEYDKAIALAKENEFLHELALANELAAKFYLSQKREKIAKIYMKDAHHFYLLWGAEAKAMQLEETYPYFLGQKVKDSGIQSTIHPVSNEISNSQQVSLETLDMGAILKSSSALSGTIKLEDLLKLLMQIIVENAGAQIVYLMLYEQGNFVIEAEFNIDTQKSKILQSIPLDPHHLALSVVHYVARSKEVVTLENAALSTQFRQDVYLMEKQPKSLLCMPLLNKKELTGILYMENNAIEGAFTQERVSILNLLSSQIAISIDNARLYTKTQKLNEQLIVLNKSYERFVPQDFLTLLKKKNIIDVNLGDHVQATMSVLFQDIRNFTSISESMTPEENFNFINGFLSVIGPVIRKHHGFIDKYIGDAIMAVYPEADEAVQCALDMLEVLKKYNQSLEKAGKAPIGVGIGINTGSLMLGTVGETNRINATVISDTVNIASRVESLTKEYKVPILITEATYRSLKNPTRYTIEMADDNVLVKGKTKPLVIFRVT